MSCFRQPTWPSDRAPYIIEEGALNSDYPVGLFVVDLETNSPTLQIIQIGEFSGQLLVAIPSAVWHRTVALRIFPSKSLHKPTLVEVAAALPSNLAEQYKDFTVKVWIGFLKPLARNQIEILEECDVEYSFDDATGFYLLPLAQALVDVANEHFAFSQQMEELQTPASRETTSTGPPSTKQMLVLQLIRCEPWTSESLEWRTP